MSWKKNEICESVDGSLPQMIRWCRFAANIEQKNMQAKKYFENRENWMWKKIEFQLPKRLGNDKPCKLHMALISKNELFMKNDGIDIKDKLLCHGMQKSTTI